MRARSAEKGPAVDNELAPAHRPQIGRPEPARGAPSNKNSIELPRVALPDIPDWAALTSRLKTFLYLACPLLNGEEGQIAVLIKAPVCQRALPEGGSFLAEMLVHHSSRRSMGIRMDALFPKDEALVFSPGQALGCGCRSASMSTRLACAIL
jgi:hypothetical protein